MQVRRVPHLSLFHSPRGLELCSLYMSGTVFEASVLRQPGFVELLCHCERWRPLEEAVQLLASRAGASAELAERTLLQLIEHGILQPDTDLQARQASDEAWAAWKSSGWEEALLFHYGNNTHPKFDYLEKDSFKNDVGFMKKAVAAEEQPPYYKDYEGAPALELPRPSLGGEPLEVALLDEVGRHESKGPLTLEELAWLSYLAFGQTSVRPLPVTGRHVAKTSPSGGSRHPTEVYPIVTSVAGVAPGIYHYNVRCHALECLSPGDFSDFVARSVIVHKGRPQFEPRVTFVFATIFERSMFRYREPFSYRVMHHDLGHLMQTTALLASSLRRNSYRTYSLRFGDVNRQLGLDGLSECAMASATIG